MEVFWARSGRAAWERWGVGGWGGLVGFTGITGVGSRVVPKQSAYLSGKAAECSWRVTCSGGGVYGVEAHCRGAMKLLEASETQEIKLFVTELERFTGSENIQNCKSA